MNKEIELVPIKNSQHEFVSNIKGSLTFKAIIFLVLSLAFSSTTFSPAFFFTKSLNNFETKKRGRFQFFNYFSRIYGKNWCDVLKSKFLYLIKNHKSNILDG